jgi:Reverse transcriptase (RNA-dependent DNA polymerase)
MDDGIQCDVVALLSFWYSHQEVNVRWHNMFSDSFCIENGTRQGGVLSPYLFTRYIREVLYAVINTRIGCNVGGRMMNILAYADDVVLLAPSWTALQDLITVLDTNIKIIDVVVNTDKTVCMVFKPKCRTKIVATYFRNFMMNGQPLQFVAEFRYLGHIVNNDFTDDDDIKREIRNLFMRTNLLIRRFKRCSVAVKTMLFKSHCLCLYDSALWTVFCTSTMNKLRSAYNKCIKIFFGYSYRYSVTSMLQEIGLSTFDTFMDDCRSAFVRQWANI